MPIYEYQCKDCLNIFENIEVWSNHKATECKACKSKNITKIMGTSHVRMDPDTVKHNLPDPSPPLEELRGKTRDGCTGGYGDKPQADTNLKNYVRTKDKYGNTMWNEKKRQYFDMGKVTK